ncbi:hypothetical protein PENTCL1PPCAC_22378, partial [Pristionchus entomophagus]
GVIYSSYNKITDNSAEYLVRLASSFQIASVIFRVEEFLLSMNANSKDSQMWLLRVADEHKLSTLKTHCFSKLRTTQDFRDVKIFTFTSINYPRDEHTLSTLKTHCFSKLRATQDFRDVKV